ncbi:glycosyltransferase [Mesorhizobium shangrilense]|uniref:Glycosyltransferase n=1 Tax=Mesorhizobium shangrilense TaxID=460060 RepID=A0ABV2DIH2_9HYPH
MSTSANVNSRDALADLATAISESGCVLVSIQHEFGIWGGNEGENIHAFLDNLTKPFVTVLHTTFGPNVRTQRQAGIVRRLVEQSTKVVVLTEKSKESTEALLGRLEPKVVVIPHGVPDLPYVPPPATWMSVGHDQARPIRMITPGFFREDKGLEVILCALHILRNHGYSVSYCIAGEAQRQFEGQAQYRARIEGMIESLGLSGEVHIEGRYLTVSEQAAAIQSAHLGIFGYQEPTQASSGTVPLVLSLGRPVLCTPFEYAVAKAREGSGVFLASGFDPSSIADSIERLIQSGECATLAKSIFDNTRLWTWTLVGERYSELFSDCLER